MHLQMRRTAYSAHIKHKHTLVDVSKKLTRKLTHTEENTCENFTSKCNLYFNYKTKLNQTNMLTHFNSVCCSFNSVIMPYTVFHYFNGSIAKHLLRRHEHKHICTTRFGFVKGNIPRKCKALANVGSTMSKSVAILPCH